MRVWTNVVEFDFHNDLFTNKGLIMDFSKENQRSSADANADQFFRAFFYDGVCRYVYYRVCQTKKLLGEIQSIFQHPHRGEQVFSHVHWLNQEKKLNCLRMN